MSLEFLILLIGTSLASFSTRYLPLVFLSRTNLSNEFKEWMNFIPVTIFGALVASSIFFPEEGLSINPLTNPYLIPSVLVLIVSLKFDSMIWSILTGIAGLFIMQMIL